MAMTTTYDKKPSEWIAGYSATGDAGAITNMTTAFPEMTQAEADEETGDIANMLYAILHKFYERFKALTVHSPTNWKLFKSESTDVSTNVITTTFTVQFYSQVAAGQQNVIADVP